MESFNGLWFDHESCVSHTSEEQEVCEKSCSPLLIAVPDVLAKVTRDKHISYLHTGLGYLSSGYVSLDASRPWIIYWVIHSLTLLGEVLTPDYANKIIDTLIYIQNSVTSTKVILRDSKHMEIPARFTSGGFGGGAYQLSHW
jgi:prenyltransferase beta subunit